MKRFALATIALTLATQAYAKPAFDCSRASTAAEFTICANDDLGRLDQLVNQEYGVAIGREDARQMAMVKDKEFLAKVTECGAQPACIRNAQTSFIGEMSALVAPHQAETAAMQSTATEGQTPPDRTGIASASSAGTDNIVDTVDADVQAFKDCVVQSASNMIKASGRFDSQELGDAMVRNCGALNNEFVAKYGQPVMNTLARNLSEQIRQAHDNGDARFVAGPAPAPPTQEELAAYVTNYFDMMYHGATLILTPKSFVHPNGDVDVCGWVQGKNGYGGNVTQSFLWVNPNEHTVPDFAQFGVDMRPFRKCTDEGLL